MEPPQQEAPNQISRDHCAICSKKIDVMIYRGTGICSEACKYIYQECLDRARKVSLDASNS